jgi:hypothetical protein
MADRSGTFFAPFKVGFISRSGLYRAPDIIPTAHAAAVVVCVRTYFIRLYNICIGETKESSHSVCYSAPANISVAPSFLSRVLLVCGFNYQLSSRLIIFRSDGSDLKCGAPLSPLCCRCLRVF